MHRRSFLKTAAAIFPSTGLGAFGLGQTPSAFPEVHIVPANQDRFGEPHSYGFSSILFKFASRDTAGGLFIIEHINMRKGGPSLHMHPFQEEWFYVMEGEVIFQIGNDRRQIRSGESVLAPRNIPHTFSCTSETPGRMLIAFTPAGKMEQYFRDTAIPNPPHQDAEFYRRYGMELIGPSPFHA